MYAMRFDMRAPGPASPADLYRTAIEMCEWGENHGCLTVMVNEHHSAADGYNPSPLILASAIAARTKRLPISVAALLVNMYDPIKLAEDMVVLDIVSGGRVSYVVGMGYRPEEYAMFGVDFKRRGAALDAKLEALVRAVDQLTTGPGTAAGEAIYTALDSIAAAGQADANGKPAAIVLLSDGVTTVGRSAEEAAQAAAAEHIPVTTIAFGTEEGTVNVQGRALSVPADPDTMARVADITDGSFFQAFSSQELKKVYDAIGNRVGYKTIRQDISMRFVTVGMILLMIAIGTAFVWAPRMV